MYNNALKIAYRAHDGQLRKYSNIPYIVHPIRIANQFNDCVRKTIAVLHDVLEDTSLTINDLNYFPPIVLDAIKALTRKEGEKYFDYINRLKKNELAIEIKIADVVDNLSDSISIHQPSMIKRYNKTLEILLK